MKTIKKILNRFSEVKEKIFKIPDFDDILISFREDFELIERWKDEILSNKQSIYVVGKTDTGKSTFHNFLLDYENKTEYKIFKESTKTETATLQILRHTDRENKRAIIYIKNKENFSELNLSKINGEFNENQDIYTFPLKNKEQIDFLNLLTEKKKDSKYQPDNALLKIEIYYPMKIFHNFNFIDTPGLGSHYKLTDKIVKQCIKGNSYIFWFLNGDNIKLSGDISLLNDERALLEDMDILNRIVFIVNKFDLIGVNSYLEEKGERINKENKQRAYERLKEKIKNNLLESLSKILNKKVDKKSIRIIFTSFKKPEKKYGGNMNTYDKIKQLERELILERDNRNLDNIDSLIESLVMILEEIEQKLEKKKEELREERKTLEKEIERIKTKINMDNNLKEIKDKIREYTDDIKRMKKEIGKIKKRKDFNSKIETYLNEINRIKNRIKNLKEAKFNELKIDEIKSKVIYNKIKNFNINKKEVEIKEVLFDFKILEKFRRENLEDKKKLLEDKLSEFLDLLEKYKQNIEQDFKIKQNEIEYQKAKFHKDIKDLNKEIEALNNNKEQITKLIQESLDINNLLLEEITQKIKEWKEPLSLKEYLVLKSFLELFHLLELEKIIKRRCSNGE